MRPSTHGTSPHARNGFTGGSHITGMHLKESAVRHMQREGLVSHPRPYGLPNRPPPIIAAIIGFIIIGFIIIMAYGSNGAPKPPRPPRPRPPRPRALSPGTFVLLAETLSCRPRSSLPLSASAFATASGSRNSMYANLLCGVGLREVRHSRATQIRRQRGREDGGEL